MQPHHVPDPDEPAFPGDFLALECNPCFGFSGGGGDGDESADELQRHALASVRAARQQLDDGLRNAVKFGRLLYRVRANGPVGTDLVALWAETRGYIERQDGDRSAPLLDHIGNVVGLLAEAEGASAKPPLITSIDLMQFEHVMRSVITMVEVAAGTMDDNSEGPTQKENELP